MGTVTWLRAASARSSARASASVAGAGRAAPASSSRSRIDAGRARSASSSSEATPMVASIAASSSGRGPTCRSTNGRPCSRSCRLGTECGLTGRASRSGSEAVHHKQGELAPPPLSPPDEPGHLRDSPDASRLSPSVDGGCSAAVTLQRRLPRAVLGPERFRGGFAPSAPGSAHTCRTLPRGLVDRASILARHRAHGSPPDLRGASMKRCQRGTKKSPASAAVQLADRPPRPAP